MGLFEQQPWLLVPLIIATVEGWLGLKRVAIQMYRGRQNASERQRT